MTGRRGRPAKPVGPSPTAPDANASPERTEQWRAQETALIEILLEVAEGDAAHALARHYWPSLWDGEKVIPPRFADHQHEAQGKAAREAVERWLRTQGRQLQWRLELAYGYCLLDQGSYRTAEEFRGEFREYGKAHARIAKHLRAFQAAPNDGNLCKRAEQALIGLYQNEGQEAGSLVRNALRNAPAVAQDCERVARETVEYLQERPARGRSGKNLAAIVIANLVAAYFDAARVAAAALNDRKTVEELTVKLSRKPVKATRRDVPDDVINFVPDNSYCHAVEEALRRPGVSLKEVGDNGWRSAVEAVCATRKLPARD